MVSAGFDAQIVRRRSGSVNNTNYFLPTLRVLAGWLKIQIEPGVIPVLLPVTPKKPLRALQLDQADQV